MHEGKLLSLLTHPYISYQIIKTTFPRNSVLLKGHHAASVVTLFFSLIHVTCMALHYSTSGTYRILCHASDHLVIYCECYGFSRALFILRYFLPCTLSFFSRLLWCWELDLKISRASCWSLKIGLVQLLFWITAICKRFICGSFYLRARAWSVIKH